MYFKMATQDFEEGNWRKYSVRLFGFPEKEAENIRVETYQLLTEQLQLTVPWDDMPLCYRSHSTKSTPVRSVVMCFTNKNISEYVLKNVNAFKTVKAYVRPNYPPHSFKLVSLAKKEFGKENVEIEEDGVCVRFPESNTVHHFKCTSEIQDFVNRNWMNGSYVGMELAEKESMIINDKVSFGQFNYDTIIARDDFKPNVQFVKNVSQQNMKEEEECVFKNIGTFNAADIAEESPPESAVKIISTDYTDYNVNVILTRSGVVDPGTGPLILLQNKKTTKTFPVKLWPTTNDSYAPEMERLYKESYFKTFNSAVRKQFSNIRNHTMVNHFHGSLEAEGSNSYNPHITSQSQSFNPISNKFQTQSYDTTGDGIVFLKMFSSSYIDSQHVQDAIGHEKKSLIFNNISSSPATNYDAIEDGYPVCKNNHFKSYADHSRRVDYSEAAKISYFKDDAKNYSEEKYRRKCEFSKLEKNRSTYEFPHEAVKNCFPASKYKNAKKVLRLDGKEWDFIWQTEALESQNGAPTTSIVIKTTANKTSTIAPGATGTANFKLYQLFPTEPTTLDKAMKHLRKN